ncbi:hypothetical protein CN615_15595 [Bacillus pseudomycoides]|nr:hypothetical protein CN615_15595 [Bacillus pseudomycoides]
MSILIRDGKLFETLGNVSLLGRNSFDRYNIKDRCDFNVNFEVKGMGIFQLKSMEKRIMLNYIMRL